MCNPPFVHLFEANYKKYVYDVNTKVILKIPEGIYAYLQDNNRTLSDKEQEYLDDLRNRGFFSTKRVKYTEHPATKMLPFYYKWKLSYVILQVTQGCNLRCEYCVYSGGYKTRRHSEKRMTFDMAKKGIDYLIRHSRDSKKLFLGFYGGEPLLEFDLIRKCVAYLESRVEGKELHYSMTTNATLLSSEKVDFLVEHDFSIMVSIDGPKEKHDEHRKFAGSGQGSFEVMMKNLQDIKGKYPEFYKMNVAVNTVLDPGRSYREIDQFFRMTPIVDKSRITASTVSSEYAKEEPVVCQEYMEESGYEMFKLFLSAIGKLDQEDVSPLLQNYLSNLARLNLGTVEKHRDGIGEKGHHGGPCIPGGRRFFLNVDGEIFPCEKVSELSSYTKLGDIHTGIDLEQAERIMNIERFSQEKCRYCWAYDLCNVCIRIADDDDSHLPELLERQCAGVRRSLEEELKNYCFLQEQGYSFETARYEGDVKK